MNTQRCEYCQKDIDTDTDAEHFSEFRNGMCVAQREQLEFPVYIKNDYFFFKIISPTEVLSVAPESESGASIMYDKREYVTVTPYDYFVNMEYKESDEKEFLKKYTEVDNYLKLKSK